MQHLKTQSTLAHPCYLACSSHCHLLSWCRWTCANMNLPTLSPYLRKWFCSTMGCNHKHTNNIAPSIMKVHKHECGKLKPRPYMTLQAKFRGIFSNHQKPQLTIILLKHPMPGPLQLFARQGQLPLGLLQPPS